MLSRFEMRMQVYHDVLEFHHNKTHGINISEVVPHPGNVTLATMSGDDIAEVVGWTPELGINSTELCVNCTRDPMIEAYYSGLQSRMDSTLSDLERWCWATPSMCRFTLTRFTTWTVVDYIFVNETNVTELLDLDDIVEDDDLRRRQLYEVTDYSPNPLHRFTRLENETGINGSFLVNRTYDQVLTGYYINVTMNISIGSIGFWNASQEFIHAQLAALSENYPALFRAIAQIARPELLPVIQIGHQYNEELVRARFHTTVVEETVAATDGNATNATATDQDAHANELDDDDDEHGLDFSDTFGIRPPKTDPDWRVRTGVRWSWDEIDGAESSFLSLEWLLFASTATHMFDLDFKYKEHAHIHAKERCYWDVQAWDTYCANQFEIDDDKTLEECALAVEELEGSSCAPLMSGNGHTCRCVPYGQQCDSLPSMAGVNLYKRNCESPEDQIPLVRYLGQTQENLCAFLDVYLGLMNHSVFIAPEPVFLCSDGLQNGDETGKDCGGSCAPCAVQVPSPCRDIWFGTFCEQQQLTRLELHNNGIHGKLESTARLPSTLRYLDLHNNKIRGSIPDSIGTLTSLRYLDLSKNLFTGVLPAGMAELTQLTYLSIDQNGLAGEINSASLLQMQALEYLNLRSNHLRGNLSAFQAEKLPRLRYLNLNRNKLSGSLPFQNDNLTALSPLMHLDVSENRLHGTLPPGLFNCTKLRYLNVEANNLDGEIPVGLGNLKRLQQLDLSDNMISGDFPETLGQLESLQLVDLSNNALAGTLPPGLDQLKRIRRFSVKRNKLVGTIPAALGALNTLRTLDVSFNTVGGRLPTALDNIRHSIQRVFFVSHLYHWMHHVLYYSQANSCQ
eukprot:SAG31_NODE_924_length_10963_cov_4.339286_8_plen_849_part_00